jgi:hypothetical protein
MPTASDLVTDLPADFETFGQAVATSMADLLGGTTGQILAKASNTDMDFTWVTNDVGDITAVTAGTGISGGGTSGAVTITNSMATEIAAKGDLIAGTGSQTFDNVSVGTNGQVLTADSAAATGLAWTTVSGAATSLGYSAGKNKVINGDFNVWQRGTTFTSQYAYVSDRWVYYQNGSGAVTTSSQQTFTPGNTISGYEPSFFLRVNQTTAGTGATTNSILTNLEDVRLFAGQTATISFWAKAGSGTPSITPGMFQTFGTGGSAQVATSYTAIPITTSWARYTQTISIPSISGKTIGTNSYVTLNLAIPVNTVQTIDFWGVQLEAGSTATAFQTATGTLQGELALCQRYYQRYTAATAFYRYAIGQAISSTQAGYVIPLKVTMRTTPTFSASANSWSNVEGTSDRGTVAPTLSSDGNSPDSCFLNSVISSANAGYAMQLRSRSDTSTFLDFSAEL